MKHDDTKQSEQKKVFDVTRPGRMAASATSRPVIVGHKPQVKDPMVSDEERKLMDSKQKVKVEPTTAPAIADQPAEDKPIVHTPEKDEAFPTDSLASMATSSVVGQDADADEKTPALPAADLSDAEPAASAPSVSTDTTNADRSTETPVKPDEIAEEDRPKTSDNPTPVQPAQSQSSETTGVVFDEAPTSTPAAAKPAANAEPLPVLPEEEPMAQQVVISHHKESNKSGAIIVLFALLLLGLLVLDVLLDAGIVVIEGIPHTDFF